MSWVEQQWLGVPRHTTSVRKQHVGIRFHKAQLSLESMLLEHQVSQTKFSNSRILSWSNGPTCKKEWPVKQACPCNTLFLWMLNLGVCVCLSRSAQTGPGTPKLGVSSLGSESSLVRMPSAWSVSPLALCNLLLDAQLEGLSHGWIQRRVC